MSSPRPDVPMRTEEIAAVLEWSTKRTARWLDGLARRDPSVIVRVNGRRTTTLATLRRVVPDIAKRFATDRDVEDLQEEVTARGHEVELIASEFREFRRKSNEWFRGLSQRTNAIEKKIREIECRRTDTPANGQSALRTK